MTPLPCCIAHIFVKWRLSFNLKMCDFFLEGLEEKLFQCEFDMPSFKRTIETVVQTYLKQMTV